jgi:cell division protease FtsH
MNDDKEPQQGNPWIRSAMIWAGVVFALLLVVSLVEGRDAASGGTGIAYSDFRTKIQDGQIKEVSVGPDHIYGTLNNGSKFSTVPVNDPGLITLLDDYNVKYSGKAEEQPSFWMVLLYQSLPFLLILGIAFFVLRQMQKGGGAGGAMGFGKSKAKLLTEKQGRVTFDDVAGIDEAREELQEIVEFLKDPQKFAASAARFPRARCWSARPAPARPCSPARLRVRRACRSSPFPARTSSRCSSASARAACATCSSRPRRTRRASSSSTKSTRSAVIAALGLGNGNDEREQTLNQLLVEMDGFEANEGIIIIAATNRPDVLDPALLRPGRFDRQVVVPRPRHRGPREDPGSAHEEGAAGARCRPAHHRARHAGLLGRGPRQPRQRGGAAGGAARQAPCRHAEFEDAKDKVMMGAERKSMVMTEDEKKMTAYHEAATRSSRSRAWRPTRSTRRRSSRAAVRWAW